MSDKEVQAHDLVRSNEWLKAIQLYDQILSPSTNNFKTPKDRVMACLFGRTECCLELGKYDNVVQDCRRLVKMITSELDLNQTAALTHRRLICALYKLKKFHDAEIVCKDWINSDFCPTPTSEIGKLLERYRTVIQMANGQKINQKIPQQRLDEEMEAIDQKLDKWSLTNIPPDRIHKIITENHLLESPNLVLNHTSVAIPVTTSTTSSSSNSISSLSSSASSTSSTSSSGGSLSNSSSTVSNKSTSGGSSVNVFQKTIDQISNLKLDGTDPKGGSTTGAGDGSIVCTYCAITFVDRTELRSHCQTESHQNVIMSDEGKGFYCLNVYTKFVFILKFIFLKV